MNKIIGIRENGVVGIGGLPRFVIVSGSAREVQAEKEASYIQKLGIFIGVLSLRDVNFREVKGDLVAKDYVTSRIMGTEVGIDLLGLEVDDVESVNDHVIRLGIEVPDPEGYMNSKFGTDFDKHYNGVWYDEKKIYLDLSYNEFVILENLGVLKVQEVEVQQPQKSTKSFPQLHEIWQNNETGNKYIVKDNKMIDASLGEHRMMVRYALVGTNQDYVREITDFAEHFTLIA